MCTHTHSAAKGMMHAAYGYKQNVQITPIRCVCCSGEIISLSKKKVITTHGLTQLTSANKVTV